MLLRNNSSCVFDVDLGGCHGIISRGDNCMKHNGDIGSICNSHICMYMYACIHVHVCLLDWLRKLQNWSAAVIVS